MKKLVLPLLFALSSASHAATTDHAQQASQNSVQQKPVNSTQQEPADNPQQKPAPSAHEEMHAAMASMCKGMDGMKMTGSIDHDFLLMMIPHHQSALDMAKAYLKEGVAPEIRETAEKIIEAQEKEIAEMETWLKENPVHGAQPHQ